MFNVIRGKCAVRNNIIIILSFKYLFSTKTIRRRCGYTNLLHPCIQKKTLLLMITTVVIKLLLIYYLFELVLLLSPMAYRDGTLCCNLKYEDNVHRRVSPS